MKAVPALLKKIFFPGFCLANSYFIHAYRQIGDSQQAIYPAFIAQCAEETEIPDNAFTK
jgi:hypothetical protein